MKKIITYLVILCTVLSSAYAQNIIKSSATSKLKKQSITDFQQARKGSGTNQTQTLFDIQFNHDLSSSPGGGLAGCVFTGTEFWVSHWGFENFKIYRINLTGAVIDSFAIAGVGGVRAMTYDGTYIYAGDNTKIIKKINPSTKALVGTITSATTFTVRGLAWDSTASGGAGGFWVSNYSNDIVLISMSGAILQTIPSATHGLLGIYGLAIDNYTSGGPYLWAHDQSNTGGSFVVRIPISTGMPDLTHNAKLDVGTSVNGLAGGLAITDRYAPPTKTIVGMMQGDLRLFGYELNDYVQAAIDASSDTIFFTPPYTQVPSFEVTPFNWTVKATNQGANAITDLGITFTLNDGSSDVFAPAASTNSNVAPGATVTNSFGPYTPSLGSYVAIAAVNTGSQTDQVGSNDTMAYAMFVTDTVMARDNSNPTNSLGIGDSTGGTLGQVFDLPYPAYITSITYLCSSPTMGDSTAGGLYGFASGTGPTTLLASTPSYIFTAADSLNGVVLTLPLTGGPMLVTPGTYFAGVDEHNFNVTLATTDFNFQPGAAWVIFNVFPWSPIEDYGFFNTFILRLNMQDATSVIEVAKEKFAVYPNPASSLLTIESYQSKPSYKAELYDMLGNTIMEVNRTVAAKTVLDVSKLAAGMYFVKTTVGDKSTTTKVSIAR